jgi:hypothetical protein
VSFGRLSSGHLLAFVAALALLLVMAPDWYTDKVGEAHRQIEKQIIPELDRQSTPPESQKEAEAAEAHEKNAWQASGAIDRLILIALLATAGLAIAATFLRSIGRDVGPPSPSALAALTGLLSCVLIAWRIINPPGFNEAAVVKWGAPAGLLCAGLVAIGSRMALRAERDGPAAGEAAEGAKPDGTAEAAPATDGDPGGAPASPAGAA